MKTFINIKTYTSFKISLFILGLVVITNFCSFGQTNIVNEAFSASTPSVGSTAWTKDAPTTWNFNYTGPSAFGGSGYAASIVNGATNKYFYVPITLKQNYTYTISFQAKNRGDVKIVANETADLVTPIFTHTVATATGTSYSLITCSAFTHVGSTTSGFVMICMTSNNYGSSTAYIDDFIITEGFTCSYPSSQATFTSITNVGSDRATLSWNRGNGDNVLIVGRKSSSVQTAPSDAGSYTANTAFGIGSQIGTGNYVLYNGSGNSVTVTNLDALTSYSFYAYEYNNTGPCYKVAGANTGATTLRSTKYYVNDNSTTGDVFCLAVGNNAAFKGTKPTSPLQSLTYLLSSSNYSATIASGDTIFVDAGTYSDVGINITKDGLNIIGAGPELTFFSSNNSSGYFMKVLANNFLLKDLTIQNYGYSSGGSAQAMSIGNGSSTYTGILIKDVEINKTGGSSGDMAIQILANTTSTFTGGGGTCNNNSQSYSGGFHVIGNNINLLISNYVLTGNSGDCFGGSHGGAMRITGGSSTQNVEIRNSTFDKNENCVSTFNAMDIYMLTGDLKVYDSYFNNSSSAYASGTAIGGSISILGGTALFSNTKFTNHKSTGGMMGCAIGNDGGTVTLQSCYFSGNSASKADDVHNASGTINANNCTWNEIGQTGGAFTIANSGNPVIFEGTIVKTNTLAPTTFTNPSTPSYTGACATNIIILPIELTRFEGYCNNGNVILNWQTASEKSNQVFNIERSGDGVNFEIIGSLKGAGNSSKTINYTFIDENKFEGLAYYRLSQTDYDGKMSQSKIIYVDNLCNQKLDSEISIYPNPTRDNFTLDLKLFQSAEVSVEIIDGIGRVVNTIGSLKYKMGLQSLNIDVNNLCTGVYFLKVIIDNKPTTHKLIKL